MQKENQKKTVPEIRSVFLMKTVFNEPQARAWLKENLFEYRKKLIETSESFEMRNLRLDCFLPGSFRKEYKEDGVYFEMGDYVLS